MASFPNQRTVTIHKPLYEKNFVQVDIFEWQEAFDALTKSSFGLYLYCCSNMNGYKLELSSAAVQNALHISDTSYRRAVKELLEKGYFIQKTTSKYDFYTSPQPTSYVPKPKKKKASGGVMDEKCRIIFCINLPSNNGGPFAYQHTEMYRHAASPSSTNRENTQLLSLFFLFFLSFHSGSRRRRLI